MAACGLTSEQCRDILAITSAEFEQFYRSTYDLGTAEMVAAVGAKVIQAATQTSHPQFFQCASFVLRARGGWRDIRAVETTTKEMPEDQKQKLIDTLVERVLQTEKQKVPV